LENPGKYGCDNFIGFLGHGEDNGDPPSIKYGSLSISNPIPNPVFPLTLEVKYYSEKDEVTDVYRILYGSSVLDPARSFFNNTSGAGDFQMTIEPDRVRISPDNFWFNSGNGGGRFMDEVVTDDGWIFPYHVPTFCAVITCPGSAISTSNPFLMPIDSVFAYGQPLVKHLTPALSLTFSNDPLGTTYNWTEDWLTLAFAPGTGLEIANSSFQATGVTFTASDMTAGWRGVNITGGVTTFDGARVTGVSYDDGSHYKRANSAVTVSGGATFTLRGGGEVSGARMAQGIEVVGATAVIEGSTTSVHDNAYAGVVAMPNANVTVRGQAQVIDNVGGGIVASGTNAIINLDHGRVLSNDSLGAAASGGGVVRTISSATAGVRTSVSQNNSGLDASDAGEILLGTYNSKNGTCTNCGHLIADNTPDATDFDAHSFDRGKVIAQGNDWNVGDVNCLRLDQDGTSMLFVEPLLVTNQTTCPGFGNRAAGPLATQQTSAVARRGGGASVLDAVLEAENALAAGDATEAATLLVAALDDAVTGDEREGVYGGALRVLAQVQPATLVTDIEGRSSGTDRPWALRALIVAAAAGNNSNEAIGYASALTTEYADTEHQAIGLGWLARLAAEAQAETAALGHLAALWDIAPTSHAFAESAAVIAAAFPDADLDWVPSERNTRAIAGKTDDDAGGSARLTVWPNPTRGAVRLSVPAAEGATLDVDVYDGLGRRVVIVAERAVATGAAFEAVLPVSGLPPGVYLVRVIQHGTDGRDSVSVVRLTITR
jgi:hypothetical protein